MRILLIGTSGFLGRALLSHWSHSPAVEVFAAYRDSTKFQPSCLPPNVRPIIRPLASDTSWCDVLASIDSIIYAAGVTPSNFPKRSQPHTNLYNEVNCDALLNLASQAAACGVKRIIYLSSFSLFGKESAFPLSVDSPLAPVGPYAFSKLNAELGLSRIAARHNIQTVNIRIPLIIGTGTFLALSNLIRRNIPLPFKGINNLRTFVGAQTLVSLIDHCLTADIHPGPLIIAGDKPPLSTTGLVEAIANASGLSAKLYTIPFGLSPAVLRILSSPHLKSIYGSLYVEDASLNCVAGFVSKYSIHDSINSFFMHSCRAGRST